MSIVDVFLLVSLGLSILTGLMSFIVWVARKLNKIDRALMQLEPNSGESLFDRVRLIEMRQQMIMDDMAIVIKEHRDE